MGTLQVPPRGWATDTLLSGDNCRNGERCRIGGGEVARKPGPTGSKCRAALHMGMLLLQAAFRMEAPKPELDCKSVGCNLLAEGLDERSFVPR